MPVIDPPANPTNGQYYNGFIWNAANSSWDSAYAPRAATIPISSPNYIINGAFDIWQRGTSFTNPASISGYTADRWYLSYDGTGATRTVSQQAFTPGSAPAAAIEGAYFLRMAQTVAGSGGTWNGFGHKIEDVRTLAGQPTTISFWAKSDAARNMSVTMNQNFGSGGSATVNSAFTTGVAALTTAWQRFTFTATLPSISGKTVGSSSYLELFLYTTVNAAITVDIWGVQVEAGSAATDFRRNAPSIQAELAACQRYYYEPNALIGSMYGNGTIVARAEMVHPVFMRTSPSVTIANGVFQVGNYTGVPTGSITNYSDTKHIELDVILNTSNTWNGFAAMYVSGGSGKITVSAEL